MWTCPALTGQSKLVLGWSHTRASSPGFHILPLQGSRMVTKHAPFITCTRVHNRCKPVVLQRDTGGGFGDGKDHPRKGCKPGMF